MTTSRPPASRSIHAEGHKGLLSNRVLQPLEYWWRDHQKWLEDRGYMLRPRYREGWTPSWGEGEDWFFRNEDSVFIMVCDPRFRACPYLSNYFPERAYPRRHEDI